MALTAQELAELMPDERRSTSRLLASGELVPTPAEAAAQAEERSQRLAEQLRALGVEPDA